MKTFEIKLTRCCNGDTMSATFRAVKLTKNAIQDALKKNKNAFNRWLAFGWTDMHIIDIEFGNIVAEGKYEFNAFAGRGSYEFKMI